MGHLTILRAVAAVVVLSWPTADCLAQTRAEVLLIQLSHPTYPQIALSARVWGDVDIELGIGQGGNVESAAVVSGPPLLQQAALDSAKRSQFQCIACTEKVTSYHLIYNFRLGPTIYCAQSNDIQPKEKDEPRSSVTQSFNHITIVESPIGGCDLAVSTRKVRSAKCLYLWKCGFRSF